MGKLSENIVKLENVLQSMSNRIDFLPAKHLISSEGFPTSVGWKKTIRAALQHAENHRNLEKAIDALLQSFISHTRVGEKLVKYYAYGGLSPEIKDAMWSTATTSAVQMEVPESPYLDAYPLAVVDKVVLKQLEGYPPVLTSVDIADTVITFSFSSVRAFYERVPLDIDQLNDPDAAAEYSELIGVRAIRRQCFDQVILDADREIVELRIDAPDGMPTQQRDNAIEDVQEAFTSLDIYGAGWTTFTDAAFNFHRLMQNLYKQAGEGSVFQLGFTATSTSTSSNNGARLLRRKGTDLRRDDFHQAGAKSVKDVSPYMIGVEWAKALKTAGPQLIILGSAKMLYTPPITFSELIIRNCFTEEDFGFISSKIDKYRF